MAEYQGQTKGIVKTTIAEMTEQSRGHPTTFNPVWRQMVDNDAELDKRTVDIAQDVGDMATVPTTAKDAAGAITELFQSGVDGKAQLETAVIAMEGTVSKAGEVATFDELESGILSIQTGVDTTDATAVAGDMRAGKTAYVNDVKVTGNVPVQAGGNVIPGPADQVKGAGIYDTPITVKGVVVPANKVLNDTTIAGTQGSIPVNIGVSKAAAAVSTDGNGNIFMNPPLGYYEESASLNANDPDFIAANIVGNIFGLQGTAVKSAIKSIQSGQTTLVANTASINQAIANVDFNSSIVLIKKLYNTYSTSAAGAYFAVADLTQANNLRLRRSAFAASYGDLVVDWTVIDFNGVKSVQRGEFTELDSPLQNGYQTRSIPIYQVNPSKCMLVITYTIGNAQFNALSIPYGVLSATQLMVYFKRGANSGTNNLFEPACWQVLEFN